MKIITQLVILTSSLLLVNATDDQYCSNLIKDFNKHNCTLAMVTINNCCDLKPFLASGVFKVQKASFDNSVNVYCDMITDGGGWTVIQRNKKGSTVDFNKKWIYYEKGFGDLNTEFWYGLEEMHCLTQRGQWEMRVDYQINDKTWSYLHYNNFSVGSANKEYPLTVGGFTGVGIDYFFKHKGMKFSTPDNDNDKSGGGNCAASHKSGWWHNGCYTINSNHQPPYYHHPRTALFTEMKIRPKDCIIHY